MRWFWQRRKRSEPAREETATELPTHATSAAAHALTDPLLAYALDYLRARQARVRIESDDLLSATLPDGGEVRYTSSSARARADESAALLVPGSSALSALLEDVSVYARHLALTLAPNHSATSLLERLCPSLPFTCGRCAATSGGPGDGAIAWCTECPLRGGGIALRLPVGQRSVEAVAGGAELAFEFTYRVTGHDHAGRHDAWVRLAVGSDGRAVTPLEEAQLAAAHAGDWRESTRAALAAANAHLQARLQTMLDATATALRARGEAAYQRRVGEARATFARLRQEQQQPEAEIEAALSRELAALRDVYGITVDAALESVCAIATPLAEARITIEGCTAPVCLRFDLGRGEVIAPRCAACQQPVWHGAACRGGHILCAACGPICANGGEALCPLCAPAAMAPPFACALCSSPLCADHAATCAGCGATCCAAHTWTCVEGSEALCLDCARLCATCEVVLCEAHAHACSRCGAVLCAEHEATCAACGAEPTPAHATEPPTLRRTQVTGGLRR